MSMWEIVDAETDTRASEVPGVGVIVANSCGMVFVPRARVWKGKLVRDTRNAPPLHGEGLTAEEIRAKQPLVADPGALSYLVLDEDAAEY